MVSFPQSSTLASGLRPERLGTSHFQNFRPTNKIDNFEISLQK
jgi:hypothetical protein